MVDFAHKRQMLRGWFPMGSLSFVLQHIIMQYHLKSIADWFYNYSCRIIQRKAQFDHYILHIDHLWYIIHNERRGRKGLFMSTMAAKKAHREECVLNVLRKKKYLRTSEVADMLDASECTVRRFFDELEKAGEAIRVYGGIKIPPSKNTEYHFENLQFSQSEQKRRIGECGSRLVEDGDIIFLDSGTTIQQMALSLVERFKNNELHDVQIFTNSLSNLTILMQYCDVNLIGGLYRIKRQDFYGYLSEIVLESISFAKCFLSADGISQDPGDGVMATDIFTAKINQIVSRRARGVYLLADSTKFVRRSFIKYASIEDVQMIVTDTNLPESIEESLACHGPIIKKV